jgi:3'-phosphoadenosine 5'-phosphosulfate sulfotransferase (PAPS reductase)/FAD synthetase
MTTKSDQAKQAIQRVFNDTSVSIDETLALMEELRDDLDEKITTLREDIGEP